MEFQIEDRVTVSMEHGGVGRMNRFPDESLVGTICCFESDLSDYVGVAFDEYIDGHTCDGACENGYGWFIRSRYLLPVEQSLPLISENKLMEVLLDG